MKSLFAMVVVLALTALSAAQDRCKIRAARQRGGRGRAARPGLDVGR